MLESLSIKNFRNFRSLEIEPLSRVNLIVGKNNVGKSNLLDAIALYVSQGAPEQLFRQLVARNECRLLASERDIIYRESLQDSLASLFYGRKISFDTKDQITICEGKTQEPLKISFLYGVHKPSHSRNATGQISLRELTTPILLAREDYDITSGSSVVKQQKNGLVLFSIESSKVDWLIGINDPNYTVQFPPTDLHGPNLQYVRTQFAHNRNNADFWDKTDLTDKEYPILEALQTLLPDLTRISYKSDDQGGRIPYIKLKSQANPIPLYSMGEGVSRILTVFFHLMCAENGTLLIDEFENGLHYTIQESLWRIIFTVAEQLDIQVFATTHSEDCLRAFSEVLKENGLSDHGSVLRLASVKGDIVYSVYGSRDLEEVLDKEMEVR